MRSLSSVVQAFVAPVVRVREHTFDGRHVTSQLVSDDHSRLNSVLRIYHAMQEALRSVLVASTLNQDVQHRPILIQGAPQPVPAFVHRERHLVQVPTSRRVAGGADAAPRPQRTELAAPESDGLLADMDAPLSEELLDIAVAEGEAVVQPDRASDDLGWKSVASERRDGFDAGGHEVDPTLTTTSTCQCRATAYDGTRGQNTSGGGWGSARSQQLRTPRRVGLFLVMVRDG
jgi:hypothetical protein